MQLTCFKHLQINLSAAAAIALLAAAPSIAKAQVNNTINSTTSSTPKTSVVNLAITESEVLAAQKAWGDALVAISTTYDEKGKDAAKALAEKVIDEAYAYQMGAVLFKPTLTKAPQTFRTTREGALAYFVGDNPSFPDDKGFALKGWRKVEIRNAGIFIDGNVATTMGNVLITDKTGKVTTVDKTWKFIKDNNGKLRIVVHHSSLPYNN
ncbi:hypothetical protein PN497_19855 [Sphaerospermopsis kisseleviana CS-549]|uniref:Phosphoribosyl-AMP cyclohydrolase n=2 Tax=Sphaerospermopsis TaxID=752201 RepID=A0A480A738_9CYAN|nr:MULTISPECIES: hypothetical protein [Sphaerospermopsis]MDB9443589.1 hypothetical protein [Sphaerospermopsis kisseleviana CS-549]BAZ80934.1 hypothetical protein NIES73_22000 [Sphaerospermopsis kisseleviana NIES-73]GCL39128.1 hypothetical protein SR1949_42500 [Sphaerospermopsis reniformis]